MRTYGFNPIAHPIFLAGLLYFDKTPYFCILIFKKAIHGTP